MHANPPADKPLTLTAPPRRSVAAGPRAIVEPPRLWERLDLAEVWARREMLWSLVHRDIVGHYKQSLLGLVWVMIQPLAYMLILTFAFGRLAKLPSGGLPYPVFVFTAMLPWQFFSASVSRSSTALVGNAGMITKVYFPRLILPLAATLSGVPDLLVSFAILLVMLWCYGLALPATVLLLPVFLIYAWLAATVMGLWLSPLHARFRDVGHVVPLLLQVWMFASPVAYARDLVGSGWRGVVYDLNPLTGIIQGCRWTVLRAPPPDPRTTLAAAAAVAVLLVAGLYFFKRMETVLADVI
jgi:lipopolysaccharide transport system permease protein